MTDRVEVNRRIIDEFRANGGVVGGQFEGIPLLLLSSKGARSRRTRTSPLMYVPDGGRYVIFGANGGRDIDPAWCTNVANHPDVTIEIGTSTFAATAALVEGTERDRIWTAAAAAHPLLADLQARTARIVPVVVLTPYD
jgi:deazaflavin-dependent oxidoreductase (nitroreductase family)